MAPRRPDRPRPPAAAPSTARGIPATADTPAAPLPRDGHAHASSTSWRDKHLDLGDARSLHVGRVARAHGIRGQLRLSTFDHQAPSLRKDVAVRLCRDDGTPVKDTRLLRVQHAPDGILVELEGVGDRNTAEALLGLQVLVARADLPALSPGELWAVDLPGMQVVDAAGAVLGEVLRVEPGTAHDMLVMRNLVAEERMVPWVTSIVTGVDRDARRVTIQAIPGLVTDEDADEPVGSRD